MKKKKKLSHGQKKQNKPIEGKKTTSCGISLPHIFPVKMAQNRWKHLYRRHRKRRGERDEWSGNVVPGEEGSTEGASEDTLQACPPRYSQLGRPSPSLLPRCTITLHFLSFLGLFQILLIISPFYDSSFLFI